MSSTCNPEVNGGILTFENSIRIDLKLLTCLMKSPESIPFPWIWGGSTSLSYFPYSCELLTPQSYFYQILNYLSIF